ncbi:MAG: transporter substrate-binding domain-containing protein [Rickettsiaceae bacterium]|nr:transporter substrate-binding domain-containing protein [Rickettsiaceae bacterium]
MKNTNTIFSLCIKYLILIFFILSSSISSYSAHEAQKDQEAKPKEAPAPEEKKKITLVSDYYCPYACTPGTDREGMLVELARKAFAKHGIEVEYKVMKWDLALKAVHVGTVDGILAAKIEEIKATFPSVSQATSQTGAFVKDDSDWFYDGAVSLRDKVVGLVEGYSYPLELRSYIYSNYLTKPQNFVFSAAENAVEQNIDKLQSGEIAVYIEDENVVNHYTAISNIKNVKNVGYVSPIPTKLYIAFCKFNPASQKYAKILTDETVSMRSNLELQKLLEKYNMKEFY